VTIQELQQFAADWAGVILRQTAAASGGNIPRGKLLVVLVEIETPNPGSGLNSARSNRRKTMPTEAPSDPSGSSAFSRCLREKRLDLLLQFSAFAAGALNPFFVMLADCHCEGETLNTLFAKIFVKRHRDPPLGLLAS
jgi:hypothetical protein